MNKIGPIVLCSEKIPISLYKHPAWVAWKETQGWFRVGSFNGQPILCRSLNSSTLMAYIIAPFEEGKKDDDFGRRLELNSLEVVPSLPSDCAFIRWDLMSIPFENRYDERQEIWNLELKMNASTFSRNFRKAPLETFCMDTMIVDLSAGWDNVYSRMEHRVRYSERLAKRRGTSISKTDIDGLGAFYSLYRKTAKLHGLQLHSESVFADLAKMAGEHALDLDIYIAWSQEKPAASAIIARNMNEAWYLFAASDPELRRAAGSTAVLCQAMRDCVECGIDYIDLLGVAPPGDANHPLSGLSRFKSGFGGVRKKRAGAWDFVLMPDLYSQFSCFESILNRS